MISTFHFTEKKSEVGNNVELEVAFVHKEHPYTCELIIENGPNGAFLKSVDHFNTNSGKANFEPEVKQLIEVFFASSPIVRYILAEKTWEKTVDFQQVELFSKKPIRITDEIFAFETSFCCPKFSAYPFLMELRYLKSNDEIFYPGLIDVLFQNIPANLSRDKDIIKREIARLEILQNDFCQVLGKKTRLERLF